MNRFFLIATVLTVFGAGACTSRASKEDYTRAASDPNLLHASTVNLTDVIVHDIFKPPVASRIYTYTFLGAYETLRQAYPEYPSLAGKVNQFPAIPQPEAGKEYSFQLAAVVAFNTIGDALTFSKDMWKVFEDSLYRTYKEKGMPDDVYENSIEYGKAVAGKILEYANTDYYKETRSGERYTVVFEPGRWVPTPPAYASACEPQWNRTRFFTMDSVTQFRPEPCAPYDMNPKSRYYALLKEVHDISKTLTQEQKDIAYFWDDNAFVTNVTGHVMFATKKMTPAGHWIAICRTVLKKENADIMKSAQAYMATALAMHDAFIASWDEKYRSNRVRPVTVIGEHIEPSWLPFLETPPFPEYVSGHSAISAAAGTVLTALLGDSIPFTDSTEHIYGHGVRSFTSFKQAYRETSDSRVYGGIHYRDGVEVGMKQGEQIGDWVIKRLQLQAVAQKQ